MENIRIEKTHKTPLFILKSGYIRLSGRSIPQNAKQQYQICGDWVEQYVQSPAKETKVELFFEYIDTSSTRFIVDILSMISHMHHTSDNKVVINWYYEDDDDDSLDLGEYIHAHLKVPFNIIPIKEGEDIPE